MPKSDFPDFPELPIGIINIVEPMPLKASLIKGCYELNLSEGYVNNNPMWKEGDSEKEKHPSPTILLAKMISDGWRLATICWKREDGSVNFGHEPTVNHVLVAVLVKAETQG